MSDPEAHWLDAELSDFDRPDDNWLGYLSPDDDEYWERMISTPNEQKLVDGYVPPRKRNRKLP